MKCNKCIFAKNKECESIECCNPHSDEFGTILFAKYDGCIDGKTSEKGIDILQRIQLNNMKK